MLVLKEVGGFFQSFGTIHFARAVLDGVLWNRRPLESVNSILVPLAKLITLRAGARSHLFVPLRGLIRTSGKCFFFLGGSRVQVSNRTDATATMSASEYGTKVFVGDVATKVRVLLWCLSRRTRLVLPPYLAACGPLSTPWAQASHCPLLSPGRGCWPARGQHT